MIRGIVDLYRIKIKKGIDGIIAVTRESYCDHIDCGYDILYRSLTVKNYNPRAPPRVIRCPSTIKIDNIVRQKDSKNIYIMYYNKKYENKQMNFEKVKVTYFNEEVSVTKKTIKPINIQYTKSKYKKQYIKKLIKMSNNYYKGIN